MALAAAASALIQGIFEKLASSVLEEFGLFLGVHEDLENLRGVLSTIQDVLEDAEKRSVREKTLFNWLRKLRDASFDADDVLDELHVKALRWRSAAMTQKVHGFFSTLSSVSFRFKRAHKIKRVMERLEAIATEKTKFHLNERPGSDRWVEIGERQTNSFIDESETYGRDEDKERIVQFLINTDNHKDISVFPILGIGGLGKTTLAQLAYNDERTVGHFELQIWVCVSVDFDVARITAKIIESATWNECLSSNVERMQHQLREVLSGKRYLLVLDDVWNENEEKWDRLRYLLKGGMQGSKVLVTTQSMRVASIMGTVSSYCLLGLSETHCWTLFRQRAFGMGRGEETPRLKAIGEEIVRKCGGSPLAAKALGSLMAFKREDTEWLAVRDSEIQDLPEDEVRILPALRLSYDHLPSRLKQCFAYCSLFPKDYEIDKEKLIELWIAEGFIQTVNERTQMEDIGNEYFNNLLWRSFFHDVRKNQYTNKITCKMHGLIHDLARYVAGDVSSAMKVGKETSISRSCRYSSLICDKESSKISKASYSDKKVRSFLLLLQDSSSSLDVRSAIKKVPGDMLTTLTHLRVLDLSSSSIRELPSTIGSMKHLRLLDMSRTDIETLPGSVVSLHNLQRLNLEYCKHLRELPVGMGRMFNIKHLKIHECLALTRMPPLMGQLVNLMTLSKFIIGKEQGQTIMELQHLNLLRGNLRIDNLEKVRHPSEAKEANMKSKENLRSLSLWWKIGFDGSQGESIDEDVLEGLCPPQHLEQLVLVGYRGTKFPNWMSKEELSSSFHNLVSITLNRLKRSTFLPPLGHLPSLKILNIYEMEAVREVGKEFYGDAGSFSSLQELTFWNMPNLERWLIDVSVAEREVFPCLWYLRIKGCPKLKPEACLPPSTLEISVSFSSVELLLAGCLGEQRSSSLKKLQIDDCSGLSTFGWEALQSLTVLEELIIQNCEELTSLPFGVASTEQLHQQQLYSLRSLSLRYNPNLTDFGRVQPKFFSALQHLEVTGCDELDALPEWLGELVFLQSLAITECPKLTFLPLTLQHLTALQDLSIKFCPDLEKRCMMEVGEDWHKIAHIPHLDIGFQVLGFSSSC